MLTWYKVYYVSSLTICMIGLVVQINEVSNTYFNFETESKLSIVIHEKIRMLAISACFRKYDILDYTRIKERLKINLKKHADNTNWDTFWKMTANLTIANYLEFTPNLDQVCVYLIK